MREYTKIKLFAQAQAYRIVFYGKEAEPWIIKV